MFSMYGLKMKCLQSVETSLLVLAISIAGFCAAQRLRLLPELIRKIYLLSHQAKIAQGGR